MSGKKLMAVAVATVLIAVGLMSWTNSGSVEADLDEVPAGAKPYGGFIKFAGVNGEAQENGYVGWSNLLGFEQALSIPTTGAGGGRIRSDVIVEDIKCTKELDKASPKLAEACCKGDSFADVTIHLMADYGDSGKVTYYEYELEGVRIVSYSVGTEDTQTQEPVETIILKATRMTVIYTEYDDMGTSKGEVQYIVDIGKTSSIG